MTRTAFILSLLLSVPVASVQGNGFFLKLPGIDGTAIDEDYEAWIPVFSYSSGFSRPVDFTTGGTRGGTSSATDFNLTFMESKASPKILESLLTGEIFQDVEFHETILINESNEVQAKWKMDNVALTSFSTGGHESEIPVFQNLSFAYQELEYTFIEFGETGKKEGETKVTFDFVKGTSSNPFDPMELADLDLNGTLDAIDLDLLSLAVRNGSTGTRFDLNADGEVNTEDRDFWVSDIYGTLPGDATLNREVDFSDFLALSSQFGQSAGWSGGDFDGDGEVGFTDFLALSLNFGQSRPTPSQLADGNASVAAVPEPSVGWGILTVICCLLMRRTVSHRSDLAQ